ncbi:probable ankyrin-1 [Coccomyxa sp. Obi]|nr:probable ankyrin-1 [Coccomyxa sp. Obi]
MPKCFTGGFGASSTSGSARKRPFAKNGLEETWQRYKRHSSFANSDPVTKEGRAQVPNGSIHSAGKATPKEHVSSSSTPAFGKGDLLERWDYYQDLVGPKNLDALSIEDRRAVLRLFKAATAGDALELARLLASADLASHINCEDADSWTPLHHAVDGNHLAATMVLVSCSADVNAANSAGDTPLHLALRWSFVETASFLIAQPGISVDAQNEDGWTALHEACCSGTAELIAPLLSRGADVNARCKDGSAPLHKAARCGSKPIVIALLKAGADMQAKDKASKSAPDGMQPEDLAADDSIARLLQPLSARRHSFSLHRRTGSSSRRQYSSSLSYHPQEGEWSVHGEARQMYESRWLHFVGKAKGKKALGKLLYTDVPWPAEEGTSAEELVAILLSGTKESEEKKRRLRAELLRWHPDKFTGHFAQYLADKDKKRILARVQEISQMLTTAAKANDNAMH